MILTASKVQVEKRLLNCFSADSEKSLNQGLKTQNYSSLEMDSSVFCCFFDHSTASLCNAILVSSNYLVLLTLATQEAGHTDTKEFQGDRLRM